MVIGRRFRRRGAMKRVSAIVFVVVSALAVTFTAVLAHERSPAEATPFVIHFSEEYLNDSLDKGLVEVTDIPSEPSDSSYSPPIYYDVWQIRAVNAMNWLGPKALDVP